jgi:hypothetical protein
MKTITVAILALIFAVSAIAQTNAAEKERASGSDRERLIGAWHLKSIHGPDGNLLTTGVPIGMLIFTRDGHISVQLMYPKSASSLTNGYVLNGYEASFGSFDINEATHTLTHHIEGSNTGDVLVGKGLPRVYQFTTDGHLIIRSARPEEHWSVIWERY